MMHVSPAMDVIFLIIALAISYPVYRFVWGVNFGVVRPGSSRFYIMAMGFACLFFSVLRLLMHVGVFDGVLSSIDAYSSWTRFCLWSIVWLEAFSPLLFSVFLASSMLAIYGVRHLHVSLNVAFFAALMGLLFGLVDTGFAISILIDFGYPLTDYFKTRSALGLISFVGRFISIVAILMAVGATYRRNLRVM